MELDKYGISNTTLAGLVKLSPISDTKLIVISVAYNNPKLAADIANSLAGKYVEFMADISKQKLSKADQFLLDQLETEKKKLDVSTSELKDFLSEPESVNELKAEFDSKLSLLTTFKKQLISKDIELEKVKAGLAASELELKNTPQIIVTKKSVGYDPVFNQVLSENNNVSSKDMESIVMKSEELNEGYVVLKSKIAEYKATIAELNKELEVMKGKISIVQEELEKIQLQLVDKQQKQMLI